VRLAADDPSACPPLVLDVDADPEPVGVLEVRTVDADAPARRGDLLLVHTQVVAALPLDLGDLRAERDILGEALADRPPQRFGGRSLRTDADVALDPCGAAELSGRLSSSTTVGSPNPIEREALTRLRRGDPEPYLAHAARRGRLQIADEPNGAKQRLLEDWWQTAEHDVCGTVMLAYRRDDVRDLNDAAHTLMLRAGRLGPEAVHVGGREFRVGDRVLCRHNDSRLGLRNGTRGAVVALDDEELTLRSDNGAARHVPLAYVAEHVEYGYALTGHAAQGATVERAYVLLPDQGALQEWGYVACTRARGETCIYLAEREAIEHEMSLPDPATPPERAARALERSAAEPLALDQTTRRHDIHTRLHARRREQLEQRREHAANRLATAQRELKQIGWWSRGNRRFELEIVLQETSLRGLDEKQQELARTPPHSPRQTLALRRDHDEPDCSLRAEPPNRPVLRHDPPSLGLEL
jgi:hypothetical protein